MTTLNRVLRALEQAEAKIVALEQRRDEPIAIVGLGCRLPRGSSPDAFWHALEAGEDAVSEIPASRWQLDPSLRKARWAALLDDDDVMGFDAGFFGISPGEAAAIDPQQRLLLEVTVEALEDAGVPLESARGSRTGAFVGMMTLDYQQLSMERPADRLDIHTATGIGACFGSGRLSHLLGLEGPSISADAACSSSLVALHLACQSLRARECDLALAGGVNLMLSPKTMHLYVNLHALSPEGRCRTFDAGANGFVRGEGCGALVLKRLPDALRDGDSIRALIRGSAVNHNGSSSGLTAPSVPAQRAVLTQALAAAQVQPSDIGYIEAHGIGTPLGDPIEIEALKAVMGAPRADGSRCAVGSVKTNIGHLEAAAGIAGVIKTVLAFEHERIPPHLHLDTLSPRIELQGTALAISAAGRAWPRGAQPRRAGVSAFGLSGTNAHVVLEEAPAPTNGEAARAEDDQPRVVVVTARSEASLRRLAARYAERLQVAPAPALRDVAYATAMRRSHHPHRLAVVGKTAGEVAASLEQWLQGVEVPSVRAGRVAPGAATAPGGGQGRGVSSLPPDAPGQQATLEAQAEVFVAGGAMAWAEGLQARGRLVRLPTYAWELERYWIDRSGSAAMAMPADRLGEAADGAAAGAAAAEREANARRGSPLLVQEWAPRSIGPEERGEVAQAGGRWLIVSAGDPRGEHLSAVLRAAGQDVTAWQWPGVNGDSGDSGDSDEAAVHAIEAALSTALGEEDARGIVVIGGAAGLPPGELDGAALQAHVEQECRRVLQLARHVARRRWRRAAPRLWLLTELAQRVVADEVDGGTAASSLCGAALWGLGRTIGLEHPALRCTRLDLEAQAEPSLVGEELLRDAADEELGLRHGTWYVGRIERRSVCLTERNRAVASRPRRDEGAGWLPATEEQRRDAPQIRDFATEGKPIGALARTDRLPAQAGREPAQGRPFRLELDRAGILEQMRFRVARVPLPGPGQVRVKVASAGLNFMDVMTAMGIYPGANAGGLEPIVLGGECAGVIDAVGPGVESLSVGEPVVALGRGCFGSLLTTDAAYVQRRPESLDAILAGGVPIVFLTAWYALITLGRLQPEERVLIHSAASGVGLAAVQIAQWRGAEIHATAGTEEKRAMLRQMGLATVTGSRTLDFAAEVLEATGGEGVDMVLNSLSGASIEASLSALASDGRFFEIGKTDIYDEDRALHLTPFRKRISYQAVDLLGLAQERKQRFAALFAEVMEAFAAGVLRPLPTERFGAADTLRAFSRMAAGRHSGKLVVEIDRADVEVERSAAPEIDEQAGYLVTGGADELALLLAEWLVEQGARRIVWMSRRGLAHVPSAAAPRLGALRARGLELKEHVGDVSRAADVAAAVAAAEAMGPLRGVVHAAAVAQGAGAWNLHLATERAPLDFFVLCSSAAALLGAPGRAWDAAGGAMLDGLARYRRRRGLVASSVQWGPVSGGEVDGALAAGGVSSLAPGEVGQALRVLLAANIDSAGVVGLSARHLIEYYPHLASGSRFVPLLAGGDEPTQGGDRALLARFAKAGEAERVRLLEQRILHELAQILGQDLERVEPDQPFKSLGIDSLMGLALRNRLEAALGITLSAALLWAYPDLRSLRAYLLGRLNVSAPPVALEPGPDEPAAAAAERALLDMRQLSEEQQAEQFEQELEALERLLQ